MRRAERQHGARLPRAAQPGAAAAPGELRPGLARLELRGRAGPGAGRPELPRPVRATSGARRAEAWRGVAGTPATGARGGLVRACGGPAALALLAAVRHLVRKRNGVAAGLRKNESI